MPAHTPPTPGSERTTCLSSIATPIVIGLIVTDERFTPGFAYTTVITIAGILSSVFLVGKVERAGEAEVQQTT